MALPPILATGSHMDLLVKSEKEVFNIVESAVALADWRWPKELHRLLKPFYTKLVDSNSDDGHITSVAASNRETEVEDPTKHRKIISIQLRPRDQHSSSFPKPVGKSVTATAAPFFLRPKPAQEKEENPRRHRTVTGVQTVKYLDYADFHKCTTNIVVRKAAATAPPPKPARETEEDPRRRRTVTGVQTVRDLDSSDFQKRTTTTTVVRKAVLE